MVRPLIYDHGFNNNVIGDVDRSIKDKIISGLCDQYIFVNTTWIEKDQDLENILNLKKIAICYSGPDWENTNCINIRRQAHQLIKDNSKEVIYLGNTRGKHYFNFWAEFIRQYPCGFFDDRYLAPPNFDRVYMCLNRKPHDHRVFLIEGLINKNQIHKGLVSLGNDKSSMILEETLDDIVQLGEQAVHGKMSIKNDILTLGDTNNWNRCFVNLVTETTVHTDVFISEKTWKPIIGLRPFLILGDQNIYLQLKELGFDTFDDVFGTWWENSNWQVRANHIISIIENITIDQCRSDYQTLYPRLVKNRQRFLAYIKENQQRINNIL
jgi:hypothetical protein